MNSRKVLTLPGIGTIGYYVRYCIILEMSVHYELKGKEGVNETNLEEYDTE
jgi:hypothetical protein